MKPEKLCFEYWQKHYSSLFYGNADSHRLDDHVFARAVESHVMAVHDPLRDLIIHSAQRVAPALSEEQAKFYMLYGGGRRFQMIWDSYRTLISVASYSRESPLNSEEIQVVNRDLN